MPASDIVIRGAREHNLRNIDVVLPRNKLICLTGVSGSGKSSLAFDTLYAEGQRRYIESLSSFARQFLGQMPKPEVDQIQGLSPSISISQKSAGNNPRSTVGTITEVYDYLRVLYARVGTGHCPKCGRPITAQTRQQIVERILALEPGSAIILLAPIIRGQKGEYRDLFEDLLKQGFVRARVDDRIVSLSDNLRLDRQMRHTIEVVIDRLTVKPGIRARLGEAVDLALKVGKGSLLVQTAVPDARGVTSRAGSGGGQAADIPFSVDYACSACGVSFPPTSPQLFSFNSPQGMCLECAGLGHCFSFNLDLLVPDPSRSFKQGCLELLGRWSQLGRWRRHIYQGVASTVERLRSLPPGTMLETPWAELPAELKHLWLWGTGDEHITFTWRGGASPIKYGGRFGGIIPDLLTKYRTSRSAPQRRRLEGYMSTQRCHACQGERLNPQARSVRLTTAHPRFTSAPAKTLAEVCALSIAEAADFFSRLTLDQTQALIAREALKEINGRLEFLTNVGLDYLTLDRTAPTLSGGESQRIRLAGQIGCGLVGVLYILDEPSIGLHPRDNDRLLATLRQLRDVGNTVVVVEHDEETMRCSDHLIDFGPGPGVRGGAVVAQGTVTDLQDSPQSITGDYLAGRRHIPIPTRRRAGRQEALVVVGAQHNNLKNVTVPIPLGMFVCVTGVSGSGKSSLVNDILAEALRRDLNGGQGQPGEYNEICGLDQLDKLIAIDQSPIGRTPRSNPGTYIKVFDDIRALFAQLPEARRRGYPPGRFSFNVKGGRCEACEGNGSNRLEMDFLADVWITCPVCAGHRFNRETLGVKFKDHSIADVLELDVQQALKLFENQPSISHKLKTLHDVGLDYLKLGQPSPTLSGGEAQRIKLARELVKKSTGRTLYLLDEPTTGLHFADIGLLLKVLHDFVDAGNTVLVVEHNLEVIKTADWIIDLGPEGGDAGGDVVACGTPEQLAGSAASHTGRALAAVLKGGRRQPAATKPNGRTKASGHPTQLARFISVRGARQHNLKDVTVEIPRDQMTVLCGPSGSGKSSLAMDTVYAEGQRRYVESLSAYARQFVSQMQKPDLEHIEGLSPAIAIEQQNLGNTPRSTVGTTTEIYDYLRILMARLGTPHCPSCDRVIGTQSPDEIIDKVMSAPDGSRRCLLAPLQIDVGQDYETLWDELRRSGFLRVRIDGQTHPLDNPPAIDRRRRHLVEAVIDRVVIKPEARSRIAEGIEAALALGRGVVHVADCAPDRLEKEWPVEIHSQHLACGQCGRSFEPLTPHSFSFNSHLGWCPECEGLGTQTGADPALLVHNDQMTLAEGALSIWPGLDQALAREMLTALARRTGIPLDQPFCQLPARQRRLIFQGTGDTWFEVYPGGKRTANGHPLFRFQFKGLYPALDEAARLAPALRGRLAHLVDEVECAACGGSRLRSDAAAVRFCGKTIDELCRLPLGDLQQVVSRWRLTATQRKIAGEIVQEIRSRLRFLNDVGLDYLTLNRNAATLSGGEAQRIRLSSQLGSGLCGVLYVLDEPTIGLHPRDNRRLLQALHRLRDLGNTLLVVEHDRDVIGSSDMVLDFGPGAGRLGGRIVATGPPGLLGARRGSVTGPFLSGEKAIPMPAHRRPVPPLLDVAGHVSEGRRPSFAAVDWLVVRGARHHNLKNVTASIPLGRLVAITGPSGSGKSSLVDDVLYAALAARLNRASTLPGAHDAICGVEFVNKVIRVDQQPLGNTPSSNPVTYTGAFDHIRQLFAQLPEAKLRGYTPRQFSFNVPGGRCETCEGNGQRCIEMHFLPDVWVPCDACQGKRYKPDTLAVTFHGLSIADVLDLTCGEATQLFRNVPKIRRILQMLCDVGLDYVTLGQPAPTLSGGEAQRVKLAAELARPDTGRTLYLLDEPTTGLHFNDLARLLQVLHRLVDLGNTVVVIEHNLDVIKSADWVIDMGPEAGGGGGEIVAAGTPEDIVRQAAARRRRAANAQPARRSYTGEALAAALGASPVQARVPYDPNLPDESGADDVDLRDVGRGEKMPWEVDGPRWHTRDRVGRRSQPCRWDGRILAEVVKRIHQLGRFSDTNWNARTIVEIAARRKGAGWFMHAITGEEWLLKLKFRVARNTFRQETLQQSLRLPTLNEMDELPVYGNEPRVRCRNLRGPWQEVELRLHGWNETNTPEFWQLLEKAVRSFESAVAHVAENPDDWMPWKKLGAKWHLSRKGFSPGKQILWQAEVLEELVELLRDASHGQFLWNNQVLVHVFVPEQREPWATVQTKNPAYVGLLLTGPPNCATLGRIADLARVRSIETNSRQQVVKFQFQTTRDLHNGDLASFLNEHVRAVKRSRR